MYMQINNDMTKAKHSGTTEKEKIVLHRKMKTQFRK